MLVALGGYLTCKEEIEKVSGRGDLLDQFVLLSRTNCLDLRKLKSDVKLIKGYLNVETKDVGDIVLVEKEEYYER